MNEVTKMVLSDNILDEVIEKLISLGIRLKVSKAGEYYWVSGDLKNNIQDTKLPHSYIVSLITEFINTKEYLKDLDCDILTDTLDKTIRAFKRAVQLKCNRIC